MKKFSNYNGFFTNPKAKPQQFTENKENILTNTTMFPEQTPITNYNNGQQSNNNFAFSNNFDMASTDNLHPSTNTQSSAVNQSTQTNSATDSQSYTVQPISMKTRKLMQIARSHEDAVNAIIAENNVAQSNAKINISK